MAAKKPNRSRPHKNNLLDILDDLSSAICLVSVAKDCLGYKNIAGDEYATLKIAIKQLLDCHQHFDLAIGQTEGEQ